MMANRRSRLQDYYEQLLGGKPSNGGTEQDAEESSAESEQDLVFPWLIPQPRPEPEPEVISVTPMVNIVSSNPPDETYGSTDGQSTGQASGADSDRQGSTDASQIDMLPDIVEVQEDFGAGGLVDGIGPDRLHAFSNLEFLRVKQDIETRPLIFQHCFQHSTSRQDALECIYAFPPDFDEDELRYLEQIADRVGHDLLVAMGGDSDGENGSDFTVPYESLVRYEEHLEDKYGFQIKWGEASDRTNMAVQLNNLEKAIGYILNYLAKEVYGDESLALEAFQQHFSQSKFGQLEIQLGTESDPNDKGYGSVPLPYYDDEGELINTDLEALRKTYLGSAVDIPTIVHEFGYVIDRSKGFTAYLEETVPNPAEPSEEISRLAAESGNYFNEVNEGWRSQYSFNLNRNVLDLAIEGFVAKQFFAAELWADLFMTAVLSGEGFEVESVKDRTSDEDDPIGIFETFDDPDGPIFVCGVNAPCFDRAVEWEDTKFADAAQFCLPKVFLALLSG
ncbi:MAG: hypothetical protein OXG78_08735 [Chloroflexi bacterium]|nr:hypothetical protein [Chloroflexota bacterium]